MKFVQMFRFTILFLIMLLTFYFSYIYFFDNTISDIIVDIITKNKYRKDNDWQKL